MDEYAGLINIATKLQAEQDAGLAKLVLESFYPPGGVPLGYQPPIESLRNNVLFRPNELSIWSGINGHGKSNFLGHVMLSCMRQGAKIYVASLELRRHILLKRLIIQATCMKLPSPNYILAALEWLKDKLYVEPNVGSASIDGILSAYKVFNEYSGYDVLVLDSLMMLRVAEDDYRGQKDIVNKLCDFKNENNCHIHMVVHPRKGSDEGQKPGKLDVKGSGVITDLADNCFTIWRNKRKEDEIAKKSTNSAFSADILQQPDGVFICDKQRNGEWEGKVGMWYKAHAMQYVAWESQKPTRFVEYSGSPCDSYGHSVG